MIPISSFFSAQLIAQIANIRKLHQTLLLVLLVFLTSGCASWLQPSLKQDFVEIKAGEYVLDKDHASLLFKINHMGFSSYVGRFNDFEVSLDFDPNNIENSRIEAIIDMRSIDVNNSDFAETLAGPGWLDTDNFPQAVFRSVSLKKVDEKQLIVQGDLTFLGVTKTLNIEVTLNGAANNPLTRKFTLGFAANLSFKRSDFGLKKFIPIVGDEVAIEIHSEFQRQ
jgi:polyisoprenoid-binding protein YceI